MYGSLSLAPCAVGEDPMESALRGIHEELGSALSPDSTVQLLADSLSTEYESKLTKSYPGIRVLYEFHTLSAVIEGLPEGAGFQTSEPGHDPNQARGGTLVSCWEWRPSPVGKHAFADRAALEHWLRTHGVDTSQWGVGAAESVEALLEELDAGLCLLVLDDQAAKGGGATSAGGSNGRISHGGATNGSAAIHKGTARRVLRQTSVVVTHVRRAAGARAELLVTKQTFPDGRARMRNIELSTKLRAGEPPLTALRRGILAKLADVATHAMSDEDGDGALDGASIGRVTTEQKESASFPNLLSEYRFQHVDVVLPWLPAASFETTEHWEASSLGKRIKSKLQWDWVEVERPPSPPPDVSREELPASPPLPPPTTTGGVRILGGTTAVHGGVRIGFGLGRKFFKL